MRSGMATTDVNATEEYPNMVSDYEQALPTLRQLLSQGTKEYKHSCCHLPSSAKPNNEGWLREISLK